MKPFLFLVSCTFLMLVSSSTFANSEETNNLNITENNFPALAVQNLSDWQQAFEISGQSYFLEPMAGLIYPCQEDDEFWFQLENELEPVLVSCAHSINLK